MKRSRARRPKKKEEEEEDIEHGACSALRWANFVEEEQEEGDDGPSRPAADSLEYYKYLGVLKTATADEIRKAYQVAFPTCPH